MTERGQAGRSRAPGQVVLVVDDDPGVRDVFRAALNHGGYEVVAVQNAVQALEALADCRVDLVLLDVELPGMGGHELLVKLRTDPATTRLPIIVVTADGGLEGKLAGLKAGANDYLIKPVSLAELLARVEAQFRDRSQWVKRIDEQLAARSWLTREIAELDPQSPLTLLESQILALLDEVIEIRALRIGRSEDLAPGGQVPHQVEVSPWSVGDPGVDGSMLTLPLRSAGRTVGVIEANVTGEADIALSTLTDLAPQIASVTSRQLLESASVLDARRGVRALIEGGGLTGVYQPIVLLGGGEIVGFEGLSRFADGTRPDVAFPAAARAGVGVELEAAAIRELLRSAEHLPAKAWVSLNISAACFLALDLEEILGEARRAVILEITEHEHIVDYERLRERMSRIANVRIAVDDAGAGYSSLRHIFELRPDFVKLDREWIADIDRDPVRKALVQGIIGFADAFGALVIGEGIERAEEAEALRDLGVPLGQGYLFGRPSTVATSPPLSA